MDLATTYTSVEIRGEGVQVGSNTDAKQKRVLDFCKYLLSIISAIGVAFYAGRRDITSHANTMHISFCAFFTLSAFITVLILMLLTSMNWMHGSRTIDRKEIILIYITTVLIMLTAASLLILLNIRYATISILLLPIMAITGMLLYHGIIQSGNATGYTDYDSELKFSFSVSGFFMSLAFWGIIFTIFSHYTNFSAQANRQGIGAPECYMFLTVVVGLVTMLLSLLPPSLDLPRARKQFVTVVKVLSYSLFGLLAWTGLAVAAAFLEGLVVLAFLPDLIGAAVWFARLEFFDMGPMNGQLRDAAIRDAEPDPLSMAITTLTFTALMFIYKSYPQSHEHNFYLQRTCVFFTVAAFLSSLGRMLLTLRPPSTRSMAALVKILSHLTVGLVALAAFFLVMLTR